MDLYSCNFADHTAHFLTAHFLANLSNVFTKCQFAIDGYTENFEIIRLFNFMSIELTSLD